MGRCRVSFALLTAIGCWLSGVVVSAEQLSFEGLECPDGWTATGALSISSKHAKDGVQSLEWQFENGGSLQVTSSERFEVAAGITCWIYNERATNGKLVLRFGTPESIAAGRAQYSFEYGLSFQGWRSCMVNFAEDLPRPEQAEATVTMLEVTAPTSEAGTVCFDLVDFPATVLWARGADRQLPFINHRRNFDWFLRFDNAAEAKPPAPAVTSLERADRAKVNERYRDWLLGRGMDLTEPFAKARYENLLTCAETAEQGLSDIAETRLLDGQGIARVMRDMSALATAYRVDGPANRFHGSAQVRETLIAALDHLNEQGWAAGSLFGDARVFGLNMGGYSNVLLLMKDELREAGIWERELATLRWYSEFGRVYEEPDTVGQNADTIRSHYLNGLNYVMCLDDEAEQVRGLHALSRWMSGGLKLAPGWGDTIKPDHTGFHHAMIVGNAYALQALHCGAIAAWVLHDTSYALSREATKNLCDALLCTRLYSNKYDIPCGIALRWPFYVESLYELIPAFAYMSEAGSRQSWEMTRAFARLWDPELATIHDGVIPRAASGYSYVDTLGGLAQMMRIAKLEARPEPAPEGFWYKPYGGLTVHRRDDWMATVKGWSKYLNNFEASPAPPGGSGRNIYGRYMSHGVLQVYSQGEPVSAKDSGYVEDGWDWNRWPGATAIYLPWDELREKTRYGRQRNQEAFVGGVTSRRRDGMFAMALSDPDNAPGFGALKSYVFVDDRIICLGSDIVSKDAEHPVETTLFQLGIAPQTDGTCVDAAEPIRELPYQLDSDAGVTMWLMDHTGNGYVVPSASGLHVRRLHQTTPWNGSLQVEREGDFELAWLDHGTAPESAEYEYMVVVRTAPDEMARIAAAPGYEVLEKSARAHVVRVPSKSMTAYAIFEAGETAVPGRIRATDVPALLVTRENTAGLLLSVCDPDLGWTDERPYSMPRSVTVTLAGEWVLRAGTTAAQMVSQRAGMTTVEVYCGDGMTTEVFLTR